MQLDKSVKTSLKLQQAHGKTRNTYTAILSMKKTNEMSVGLWKYVLHFEVKLSNENKWNKYAE